MGGRSFLLRQENKLKMKNHLTLEIFIETFFKFTIYSVTFINLFFLHFACFLKILKFYKWTIKKKIDWNSPTNPKIALNMGNVIYMSWLTPTSFMMNFYDMISFTFLRFFNYDRRYFLTFQISNKTQQRK
jgi:hypothetical protein